MRHLWNTVGVAGGAAVVASLLGWAFAGALLGAGRSLRRVAWFLAAASFALPPFLVANCWLELSSPWRLALGAERAGIAMLPLVAVVLGLMHWPVAAFLAGGAWSRVDREVLDGFPGLAGMGVFRHLLWPAGRPALGLGFVTVFVLAASNFAIPTLFQVRVLPERMWVRFNTQLDFGGAWWAGLPLVVLGAVLVPWVSRAEVRWPSAAGAAEGWRWRRALGGVWWAVMGVALAGLTVSLAMPLGRLLGAERTWAELGPAFSAGVRATATSGGVALGAGVLGMILAWVVSSRFPWGRWGAWGLFLIPGILTGSLWAWVFARPWMRPVSDSVLALLLVEVPRHLAVALVVAGAARGQVDPSAGEALRCAGASEWAAWWRATWPQVRTACLAGAYAVYLLVLWDVESVVLVMPPGVETLALRVFNLLHYGHASHVNALCLVLLGLAVAPALVWAGFGRVRRGVWLALLTVGLAGLGAGCSPEAGAERRVPLKSGWFSHVEVIGTRGVGPGQFNKPRSLACDREDNLYVADFTGRIQKFDREGRFVRQWQMPQTDLGKPKGMGLDPEGRILVVEPHYMRVNHFDGEGRLQAQWGRKGTNPGSLILPRSIAVSSAGEYFISEYTVVDRIQRFGPLPAGTGGAAARVPEHQRTWGEPGAGPGQFNRAEGIGMGPGDTVYVADSCNHRIQVFDREGKFLRQHGRAGSNPGEFSYPYDIRVDASGNQFVCEFGNSRITVLDARDQVLEVVGGAGAAPGQFANPWSIAVDSRGNLYVADSQNHRVQKLIRRSGG